jgi:hypothetical protein
MPINYTRNNHKKTNKNKTKRHNKNNNVGNVEIGLKAFEEKYGKTLSKDLVKSNEAIKNADTVSKL